MTKTVDAILRGPSPFYKGGTLYVPGQIVPDVPADRVSEDDEIEIETERSLLVQSPEGGFEEKAVLRKERKRTMFRPLDKAPKGEAKSPEGGDPARLNVTDFLKGGADDIVSAIASGKVDPHLSAIEQAELARRGPARAAVKEAIAGRLAAIAG